MRDVIVLFDTNAIEALDGAWSTTTHDADAEPGVARTLRIEQPDGRVLPLESWPRSLLDRVHFAERLAYFSEFTRGWQRMLVPGSLAAQARLSPGSVVPGLRHECPSFRCCHTILRQEASLRETFQGRVVNVREVWVEQAPFDGEEHFFRTRPLRPGSVRRACRPWYNGGIRFSLC